MSSGVVDRASFFAPAEELLPASRTYRVSGGRPLRGTLVVGGSKNAVAKQLVASLLTDEPCLVANVPRSGEIASTLAMLAELGTRYRWTADDTLLVHTPRVHGAAVSRLHARYSRLPILLLVALLHRTGAARVPAVGGCTLGARPVDFHLAALEAMGAQVSHDRDGYTAAAAQLRGADIRLPYPSVGATESVLLAACLADGATIIHNAAVEPEVLDTILLLEKMGASVRVEVDRTIRVVGVRRLHGAFHAAMPDRTEVVSFAAAAVATGGAVSVPNACQQDLSAFLQVWRLLGADFAADASGLKFFRTSKSLQPIHVETGPHPAFMTDWQPLLAVLAMQAEGTSTLHETVFENRFRYASELRRLGGHIEVATSCPPGDTCRFNGQGFAHTCYVRPSVLRAGKTSAADLRAGFACLVAALVADGVSEIHGAEVIERGYGNLVEKLRSLGADIEVV